MTDNLVKVVVDCATGAVSEVPLTAEEISQREIDQANAIAEKEAAEAEAARIAALKVSARQKLVAGEALTEEEAALLVL